MLDRVRNEYFKILKNQLFSICFKVSSVVLTFVLTKVFISNLGFQRYGDFVLIHGYLIVLSALVGSGYGVLFLKKTTSLDSFDYQIILRLLLAVLMNVIIVILIILIININFDLFSSEIIYSVIFYSLSAFFVEVIRSKTNGNIYVLLKDILRTFILMILVVVLPGKNNIFLINLSSGLALICIIVYLIVLFVKYGLIKNKSTYSFRNLFVNGSVISLVLSSQFLKNRLDVFLVDLFFNKTIVGMYDVLMKLGQVINLPKVALNADLATQLANSIKLNEYSENLKRRIKVTKYLGYFTALCCFIILPFYLDFYGYETSRSNLLLASLVIFIQLIACYFGPIGLFSQLSSLKKYSLMLQIITIICSFFLSYLLVKSLGIFAIAITNASLLVLTNYLIREKMKIKYNFTM